MCLCYILVYFSKYLSNMISASECINTLNKHKKKNLTPYGLPRDYRSVARVEPFLVFNEYTLDAGQENKKERVMVECNFTRTRHQQIFVDMTKK